jgi:hypothetical protein
MPRGIQLQFDRSTWLQLALRFVGWAAAVISVVVLGYMAHRWPGRGSTIAAGMIGACLAMLNDSIEIAGMLDQAHSYARLAPPRVLLYDLLSLAVSLGGIILILFSELGKAYSWVGWSMKPDSWEDDEDEDDSPRPSRRLMTILAMWMLGVVALWRFIFCIWACCDSSSNARSFSRAQREVRRRQRARRERLQEQTGHNEGRHPIV